MEARPSEAAVVAAAEALLLHLEGEMGAPRDSIVLVGQSIGSGVALAMAEKGFGGGGLVLLSPFTSLVDMAAEVLPWLRPLLTAFPFFLRDRLDNASRARAAFAERRTLIVHGTRDEVVPFTQGQALAAAFPDNAAVAGAGGSPPCRFVALDGFGHNDVWEYSGMVDVGGGLRSERSLLGLIVDFAMEGSDSKNKRSGSMSAPPASSREDR